MEVIPKVSDFERRKAKYAPVRERLAKIYGALEWHGTDPMDELVSCILSQSTTDLNRDRAFFALKERYPSWQQVMDAPTPELVDVLRQAGLANQKAPRIQAVLRRIYSERGAYNIDFLRDMPIEEAKNWLTSLDGVGPKTAAIVLCFAFGLPAFPVDTHIHRVGMRIGFLPDKISADKAHPVMEAIAPPDDYFAFHIYLIKHGRDTCTARRPYCERCPITDFCDFYAQLDPKPQKQDLSQDTHNAE